MKYQINQKWQKFRPTQIFGETIRKLRKKQLQTQNSEAYSESYQTSKTKHFAKIANNFQPIE